MGLSRTTPVLALFVSLGCAAEPYGTTNVLAGSTSWALQVDTATGALIDTRCAAGGDCTQHPNPFECERMDVNVDPNGQLCGMCNRAGFANELCGGFASGLPYNCNLQLDAGQACVVCSDIRGQVRYRDCSAAAAPAPGTSRAGCLDITHAVTGQPCQICLDAGGIVQSTTCAPGAAGGDIAPVTPGGMDGDDRVVTPPADPSLPVEPGETAPPAVDPCEPAFHTGSQAFINTLNQILQQAGFPADRVRGALAPDGNALALAPPSTTACGSNRSDEYLMGFQSVLPFYHDAGNDWTRFGKPRCMLMGLAAAERTLEAPCMRGDQCLETYIAGVQAEQAVSVAGLNQAYDCQGSPIVLDLDGDGVETQRAGTSFDLGVRGMSFKTAWIRPGDALLARDLDGDGRVTSGVELFGEATLRGPAADGYAVLRELDANRDGVVNAEDPAFGELMLWVDDGDAISEDGELVALSATDIVELGVQAVEAPAEDVVGSTLGLWSGFQRADGSAGVMCDVFFAMGE